MNQILIRLTGLAICFLVTAVSGAPETGRACRVMERLAASRPAETLAGWYYLDEGKSVAFRVQVDGSRVELGLKGLSRFLKFEETAFGKTTTPPMRRSDIYKGRVSANNGDEFEIVATLTSRNAQGDGKQRALWVRTEGTLQVFRVGPRGQRMLESEYSGAGLIAAIRRAVIW